MCARRAKLREMFGFLANLLARFFEHRKRRPNELNFRGAIDNVSKELKLKVPHALYADFLDKLEAAYEQTRD